MHGIAAKPQGMASRRGGFGRRSTAVALSLAATVVVASVLSTASAASPIRTVGGRPSLSTRVSGSHDVVNRLRS